MGIVEWIIVTVVVALLLLIGAAFLFTRVVEKKIGKSIGFLYIDPDETSPGEGVYALFYEDQDPKAFTDGSTVMLTVKVVRK